MACARTRLIRLAGGALAMGVGIWSMHFIEMLSSSLSIPLDSDLAVTGYSLLIAVLVSWFALYIGTRNDLSLVRLLVGGVDGSGHRQHALGGHARVADGACDSL
ncbi:MHYT domain-containing protein [Paraburkholderia fynbosensis]|uniref:MHYT domain-containing protein n=1 Tax=Paraburkholderia fynbosensis TaxID=1200993 RepID=UPI0031B62D5F